MKILLVEDSATWAELINELLNENGSGVEIIHAEDGQEALKMLSTGYLPDIIISDMRMPRMDGHDLLMEVKSNACLRAIPFIMLSSASCSKEMIEDHGCKATCHISKSFFIDHNRSLMRCFKELIIMTEQEQFLSEFTSRRGERRRDELDLSDSAQN